MADVAKAVVASLHWPGELSPVPPGHLVPEPISLEPLAAGLSPVQPGGENAPAAAPLRGGLSLWAS